MNTEKLTSIERALIAASTMDAHRARDVLMLICQSGLKDVIPKGRMTRAESIHRKRAATAETYRDSIKRVLDYAKHETLRNVERHFRTAIQAADSSPTSQPDNEPQSPAVRTTFNKAELEKDLLSAIAADHVDALETAGQELYDEIGRSDPFKMPAKATVDFLRKRENLLSGVSDEIHKTIENELAEGIDKQEPLKELVKRISGKFEEIYKGRGKVIADTETAAAYGYARNKAMKAAGIERKKWLHSPLAKEPRPEHIEMSGKVVPFDEPFPTGDPPLMYPHDPNGSPEDVINCHCIAIPVE